MKAGRIIAEDTPSNLRARLKDRILELRGSPLNLLRRVAHNEADVEDVQAFGDRLHIRVGENKAQDVLSRLKFQDKKRGRSGGCAARRSIHPRRCLHRIIGVNMNEAVIKVENLTRRFGDFVAVDHINFDVHAG